MSPYEADDRIGDGLRIFVMHHVTETGQPDCLHVAEQCVHAFVAEHSESAVLVARYAAQQALREAADMAAEKLAEVDAKIADLNAIRTTLIEAIAAGCDDLITCAATADCPLPFADTVVR